VLTPEAAGRTTADPEAMAAQPRRIMVAYDGSDASVRALDAAADLVGYGSTLAVVTVQTRFVDGATVSAAREQLLRRHVEARYFEPSGEPAEQLVETAKELGADLIVVGRRSQSQLRALLGSVSARVVRRAPCDVLVVR
jgi:nucleotide-binding universal stress UspA family protein